MTLLMTIISRSQSYGAPVSMRRALAPASRRGLSTLARRGGVAALQEAGEAGQLEHRFLAPRARDAREGADPGAGWRRAPVQEDPGALQRARSAVLEARDHLLPKNYGVSVGPRYVEYVQWSMAAGVVGTTSGVISMQSLLMAVGLGQGAIPTAAALNWILKDGLGQLGGVLFASSVNQRFDAEPKRWRLKAAAMLDASILLEVATPWFPQYFLPIASIANIGKNIGWLSASATRANIHRSFMREENLGDITGKAGSQTIASSVIGTGAGIALSSVVGSSTSTLLATAAALSVVHMGLLYKSLQTVTIRTLNLQRLWLALRPAIVYHEERNIGVTTSQVEPTRVLSPEEVAPLETVVHFGHLSASRYTSSVLAQEDDLLRRLPASARKEARLRIGSRLDEAFPSPEGFEQALHDARRRKQNYLVSLLSCGTVHLLFLRDARSRDVLMGTLHAMHVYQAVVHLSGDIDDAIAVDIVEACRLRATRRDDPDTIFAQLAARGWDTEHLFFEPYRARIVVADNQCGDE